MTKEQMMVYARSLAIALVGFALAWVTDNVIPKIDQSNSMGMAMVAFWSVFANFVRKQIWPEPVPPPAIQTTPPTVPVPPGDVP